LRVQLACTGRGATASVRYQTKASGDGPGPAVAPERAPEREVRASITRAVPADRFMVGSPAPGLGDPDRAAYDVLDQLLTGGPSARLPRALMVERELASSIDADVAATRDPGLWTIVVQMRRGTRAEIGDEVIRRELARLIETAPPLAEMEAARNRLETDLWTELGSSPFPHGCPLAGNCDDRYGSSAPVRRANKRTFEK